MPTTKPRITITLSDEQHATLHALSQLQGVSMSSIVVDLVDTTLPVLQRLTEVLKNASQAPQAVLDSLRASLDSAESEMVGHGAAVMGQLDMLVKLGAGAVDVTRSGAAAVPEPKPPTSNRGVRNVPTPSKNRVISPSKSRASINSNGRSKK
uniref:Uncharacterized protein n=1 Tax=uncultured prokaryote TaxID=198431 RepID=A0A0H5Q4U8_9ZZZZ|nr:hypothetical protein [uncultured prokaryote]